MSPMTDGVRFAERFHRPRAEWVWDRELNPGLTARATLRAVLAVPTADDEAALETWLRSLPTAPRAADVRVHGGAAIEISRAGDGIQLLFVSGGQDAWESLDSVVVEFHDAVLRSRTGIEVEWEELPLHI